MIEGLKVTVAGAELAELCLARVKFHDDRRAFYEQQKQALPDIDDSGPSLSNVSSRPQDMMQERIKNHRAEGDEMRFIAAHINLTETYQLGREDLTKLGIASSRY